MSTVHDMRPPRLSSILGRQIGGKVAVDLCSYTLYGNTPKTSSSEDRLNTPTLFVVLIDTITMLLDS